MQRITRIARRIGQAAGLVKLTDCCDCGKPTVDDKLSGGLRTGLWSCDQCVAEAEAAACSACGDEIEDRDPSATPSDWQGVCGRCAWEMNR